MEFAPEASAGDFLSWQACFFGNARHSHASPSPIRWRLSSITPGPQVDQAITQLLGLHLMLRGDSIVHAWRRYLIPPSLNTEHLIPKTYLHFATLDDELDRLQVCRICVVTKVYCSRICL